jgi:hypothetical protein
MNEPGNEIPITQLPIHVYRPMEQGRPFYAYIEKIDLRFSAPTAMGAKKAARDWAKENCKFKPGKVEADAEE